jgi:hypothetical protein
VSGCIFVHALPAVEGGSRTICCRPRCTGGAPGERLASSIAAERPAPKGTSTGDPLEPEREVNHHLRFLSEEGRDSFARAARELGFLTAGTSHDEEDALSFGLRLTREDSLALVHIHGVTLQLCQLVDEIKTGQYDGWEALLLKNGSSSRG